MKIIYDKKISPEYVYPLTKSDLNLLKEIIPIPILEKISCIAFGCNTKTTQEARITQRGMEYRIRMNFFIKNFQSRLLSTDKHYVKTISLCGGLIDFDKKLITWDLITAKLYSTFIIVHEIGHIIYATNHNQGNFLDRRSVSEERWCDNYSMDLIKKEKHFIINRFKNVNYPVRKKEA